MSLASEAPTVGLPAKPYLEGGLPVVIILGSFFVLTIPFCLLGLTHPQLLERFYVRPLFIWLLATTHFAITFTIYMQSQNLRYFNSNWTTRLTYFLIPVGIFVFFDLYTALEVALVVPGFDTVFRACIRLMDNYHVTRQSFGVTQLFKKRSGLRFPPVMRQLEDVYFHVLTALLLMTFFAGGSFKAGSPAMLVFAGIAVCLFLAVLAGYVRVWKQSQDRQAAAIPLVYFVMQSISASLGIYQTSLYLYCLSMHYVEYHVLMIPRCFNSKLDPNSPTDRIYGSVRRHRIVFFAILTLFAGVATYFTWITMGAYLYKNWDNKPVQYRILLALFDGLAVFHYFVEAFIWKFGNPYYKETLGPLYFGRPKTA